MYASMYVDDFVSGLVFVCVCKYSSVTPQAMAIGMRNKVEYNRDGTSKLCASNAVCVGAQVSCLFLYFWCIVGLFCTSMVSKFQLKNRHCTSELCSSNAVPGFVFVSMYG